MKNMGPPKATYRYLGILLKIEDVSMPASVKSRPHKVFNEIWGKYGASYGLLLKREDPMRPSIEFLRPSTENKKKLFEVFLGN